MVAWLYVLKLWRLFFHVYRYMVKHETLRIYAHLGQANSHAATSFFSFLSFIVCMCRFVSLCTSLAGWVYWKRNFVYALAYNVTLHIAKLEHSLWLVLFMVLLLRLMVFLSFLDFYGFERKPEWNSSSVWESSTWNKTKTYHMI